MVSGPTEVQERDDVETDEILDFRDFDPDSADRIPSRSHDVPPDVIQSPAVTTMRTLGIEIPMSSLPEDVGNPEGRNAFAAYRFAKANDGAGRDAILSEIEIQAKTGDVTSVQLYRQLLLLKAVMDLKSPDPATVSEGLAKLVALSGGDKHSPAGKALEQFKQARDLPVAQRDQVKPAREQMVETASARVTAQSRETLQSAEPVLNSFRQATTSEQREQAILALKVLAADRLTAGGRELDGAIAWTTGMDAAVNLRQALRANPQDAIQQLADLKKLSETNAKAAEVLQAIGDPDKLAEDLARPETQANTIHEMSQKLLRFQLEIAPAQLANIIGYRADGRRAERTEAPPAPVDQTPPPVTMPALHNPERIVPLNPDQVERAKELVAKLGSARFDEREAAQRDLEKFGKGLLPHLKDGLRSDDPEVRRRCDRVYSSLVAQELASVTRHSEALLHGARAGVPMDKQTRDDFRAAIATADKLATDERTRAVRRGNIEFIGTESAQAKAALAELDNPAKMRSDVRLNYGMALVLSGEATAAKALLSETMSINKDVVKDSRFLHMFAATGSHRDPDLLRQFVRNGGDVKALGRFIEAQTRSRPGTDTTAKQWDSFDGVTTADTMQMKPEDRLARYQSQKATMTEAQRTAILTDHYRAATTDNARDDAMRLLEKEARDGNNSAKRASEQVGLFDLAYKAQEALDKTWGPKMPSPPYSPQDRLSFLADNMRSAPSERDHHHTISVILDHYRFATTKEQRAKALDLLREDVQNGNLTAALALRQLATVDGVMRVVESARTLQDPNASPEQKSRARREQMDALRDLARMEYADRKGKDKSAASQAIELLGKNPALGVSPLDIQRERTRAQQESQQREATVQQSFAQAISGRGTIDERVQALARLQQAATEQLSTERIDQHNLAFKTAARGIAAEQVTRSIESPEATAEALLKFGRLARTDEKARDILNSIGGPKSAELLKAIKDGDKETIKRLLSDADLVKNVGDAFKAPTEQFNGLQRLKPEDALLASVDPKVFERLVQEAKVEDRKAQERADGLVADYLDRESDQAKRDKALNDIRQLSRDRLHLGLDFETATKAMESIDNARKVHEALAKVERSTGEARNTAITELIQQLEEMKRLQSTGVHHFTSEFIKQLPAGTTLDTLLSGLRAGGNDATQALEKIKTKISDGQDKANEIRTLRIVRNLGPESTPEDFAQARRALEKDVADSTKNGGKLNRVADDFAKWTKAAEAIVTLSKSTKENNTDEAKKAVDTLVEEAKKGNTYARQALASVLASNADTNQMAQWWDKNKSFNDKPVYVPNLGNISEQVRNELMRKAADGLSEVAKTTPLNQGEAAAIALSLSRTVDKNADNALQQKLVKLLDDGMAGTSRSSVMNGIFDAIETDAPASKVLAPIYLKGIKDDPVLDNHMNGLERLGRQNNEAALRILSAITSGAADDNSKANPKYKHREGDRDKEFEMRSISARARTVLEYAADQPGMRDKVVDALLFANQLGTRDDNFKDKNQLLSTLGKVASQITDAEKIATVTKAMRDGFSANNSAPDSLAYKSAMEGMLSMAKHWKNEDLDLFTAKLSKEVIAGLRQEADNIPAELKTRLLARLQEKVGANGTAFEERLASIQAMAALGKYLTKDQVTLLASFGGDARWNRGGQTGDQKLAAMGITDADKIKQVKAEVAEALLSVLAKGGNAPQGEVGPRELAFDAFKTLPWQIKDGKGGYLESRDSEKLRAALVDYFQGRPFDIHLAEQINKIVDSAQLPRPAAAILHRMGFGDAANPADARLLNSADTIVRNYTTATANGEDVLRKVVSNIQLLNSLPGSDRAKLMGWDKLTADEKRLMGWMDEPPAELKARVRWDQMSDKQKEDFRWQGVKVDAALVFGQMKNNLLQQSENALLLTDLSAEMARRRDASRREVDRFSRDIRDLQELKKGNADKLEEMTKKGVSLGSKILNIFNNAVDDDFDKRQSELARSFAVLNARIAEKQKVLGEADHMAHSVELSRQVGDYSRLLNEGKQVEADRLALRMWQEHGPLLAQLAPKVWEDLTVSKDSTLQGASLLKRLQERGLAQWDRVPGYEPGEKGFRAALGLENATNVAEKRGIMQLSRAEKLDSAAMRTHMFSRIDQDDTMQKISGAARGMNEHLGELSKMFGAAMVGTKYDTFIAVARDKAAIIKQNMDKITVADLRTLERRISSMEEALREMKKDSRNHNPDAMRELEDRIKTYKGMHNLFNRFDKDPKYPEVMEKTVDDKGNKINQNKQVREMLDTVLGGGLTPSTFTQWCKENALTIGLTIAACAATVAACATLGIGSPVAVGFWVAVAGLAAREVSSEIMFHVNRDGYTGWGQYGDKGAKIAHWTRQASSGEFESFGAAMKALGTDVALPYAKEILRDWAAFVVTAGLSNYFFGGSKGATETLKALIRKPPANLEQLAFNAERAAMMANGTSRAGSFMRQFMQNFGRELVNNLKFTGMQMSLEGVVHEGIRQVDPEALHKLGEWGNFGLSFALSTAIAMGQGYRHGKQLLAEARMAPNNTLEFKLSPKVTEAEFVHHMKLQGFDVSLIQPGKWQVLPFNAKPGTPPIIMENMANRGEGNPPVAETPDGKPMAKRTVAPHPAEVDVAEGTKWKPSTRSTEALNEVGNLTDHLFAKRYEQIIEALRQNVGFDIDAFNNAGKPARADMVRQFISDLGTAGDAAKSPRPVATIKGVEIDLVTGKPTAGNKNTNAADIAAAEAQVRVFQSTPEFGQMMREVAKGIKVHETAVPFDLDTYNRAPGPRKTEILTEFMRDMGRQGRVNETGDVAQIPRPTATINGVEMDLITGKPTANNKNNNARDIAAATREVKTFQGTPEFQRIMQERAIIAMEERIHLRQIKGDHEVLSPSFAKFVREMMTGSDDHMASFHKDAAERAQRSRAVMEQELIMALYDKGWTLEQLKHHFGKHHADVREPVFRFIELTEVKTKLPNDEMRAQVDKIYKAADPEAQKVLLEKLQEMAKASTFPTNASEILTAMEYLTGNSLKTRKVENLVEDIGFSDAKALADPHVQKLLKRAIESLRGDLLNTTAVGDLIGLKSTFDGIPELKQALQARVLAEVANNPHFATRSGDQLFSEGLRLAEAYGYKEQFMTAVVQRIRHDIQHANRQMDAHEKTWLKDFIAKNKIEPITTLQSEVHLYKPKPPAIEPNAHPDTLLKALAADGKNFKNVEFKGTSENGEHVFTYKDAADRECMCRIPKTARGMNDVLLIVDSTGKGLQATRYAEEFNVHLTERLSVDQINAILAGNTSTAKTIKALREAKHGDTGLQIYEVRFPDKLRTYIIIDKVGNQPRVRVLGRSTDVGEQNRIIPQLKKKS